MSRATALAPDVVDSQPEQRLCRPSVPHALLDEAQAEQALWQEFRNHDASISNALTKALWLHGTVIPAL
jgi:hypothetical protein